MGALSHFGKKKVDWNVNTEGWDYIALKDLAVDTVYALKGCFITPDKGYGRGAVLISDSKLVNIPNRYVDRISELLADAEAIEEIKACKIGFKYTTFVSDKYKRTGYSVEFVAL